MGLFDNYLSRASFDEMLDPDKALRPHWKMILESAEDIDPDELESKQAELTWYLEDNGVTYNLYNTPEGTANRPWSLDPIPFVLPSSEWQSVTKGLNQRAKVLNALLRDIYGDQNVLKDNIIPSEIIFGHNGFLNEVYNFGDKEHFQLYFYAADMARGPDGKMWVIADRTQAPSGLGYAIENRLATNVIAKDLYPNIEVKKLFHFVDEYKSLIQRICGGNLNKAALLTPGSHNETYFEHAFLSSFLEIDLVQGGDLLVKNNTLWLKSLSGLKKINTLVRRVDDRFCDPLELRSDSQLGVAGLVDVMRHNNVAMLNPIGSAVLENVGLNAFMESLCKYYLGEELLLPQIATWWCGQEKERNFVLENLSKLVIKRIDKGFGHKVYLGKHLEENGIAKLKNDILQNPVLFVAQEEISFSTTPYYAHGTIEPRNAVIRSYGIKTDEDYTFMDGGLVRVSASKDTFLVSSQKGGTSKDLWVLSDDTVEEPTKITNTLPFIDSSIRDLPTLRAENLFWLGRYLARAITTARLIRFVVKRHTNYSRYDDVSQESLEILRNTLTHLTMTYPGFLDKKRSKELYNNPFPEMVSIIRDNTRPGSLAFTIDMLQNAHVNVKNMLAVDSWKLFDRMQKSWKSSVKRQHGTMRNILDDLDKLLIHLMAYKELVEESMSKEQGLLLFEIGHKMESGSLMISQMRAMLCTHLESNQNSDVLEGILQTYESYNAYRARYKSSMRQQNVVEFLLLEPQFPKSLTSISDALLGYFKELPKAKTTLSSYEEPIFRIYSMLRLTNVNALMGIDKDENIYTHLDTTLSKLFELFSSSAQELSQTYFSHYDE